MVCSQIWLNCFLDDRHVAWAQKWYSRAQREQVGVLGNGQFFAAVWGDKFEGFWENETRVVSELHAAGCQSLLRGFERLAEFKKPVGSIIPYS
jgi:hypothetical protein